MDRVKQLDLASLSVREVNQFLHHGLAGSGINQIDIVNPDGAHSIAAAMAKVPLAGTDWIPGRSQSKLPLAEERTQHGRSRTCP
jgi:hypothetical protein